MQQNNYWIMSLTQSKDDQEEKEQEVKEQEVKEQEETIIDIEFIL